MSAYEKYRPEILIATCIPLQCWCNPNLSAPYWRFYWNDRPGAVMTLGGKRYPLTPAEGVIIPPGTPYASSLQGHPYHLNCNFIFPSGGVGLKPGIYALPLVPPMLSVARRCAAALAERPKELAFSAPVFPDGEVRQMAAELGLQALVTGMLAQLPLVHELPDSGDPRVDLALTRLKRALEEGRGAELSSQTLADWAGVHRNSLTRLFRKCLGLTPQECLARRRVDYACILLHRRELEIPQIAARLGYCDRYHFSREFRRLKGIPPAAFRNHPS